jgi:stalled ribosome rescue protein Dom34
MKTEIALDPGAADDARHPITTRHAAVWLDHKHARVFSFNPENFDEATVLGPPHNDHHKHTRGQEGLKEHPEDIKRFYHDLVGALQGVEELLIVGPAAAKLEFFRYVHQHDHALEAKVVGIETVDHPSDGQIVAFAKKYFKRADRMR